MLKDVGPTDALALHLNLLGLTSVEFCDGLYTFQHWVSSFLFHAGEPSLEIAKHVLPR